jgi:hypothetical protein
MSGVAAPRGYVDFDDAELAQGEAALAALGITDARIAHRLVRTGDGAWRVSIRVPRYADRAGRTLEEWTAFVVKLVALEEAVALLAPGGPDDEVRRRAAEAHGIRRALEAERVADRERERAERAEHERHAKQREELGGRRWDSMPQEARAAFRIALAAKHAGLDALARELRTLAAELEAVALTARPIEMPMERWDR